MISTREVAIDIDADMAFTPFGRHENSTIQHWSDRRHRRLEHRIIHHGEEQHPMFDSNTVCFCEPWRQLTAF